MQRVQNISKNYKYQSALPTLYTPHSILPYAYCQDGGCVPVVYGVTKISGSVLFSGFAVLTSGISAWIESHDYIVGDLVLGTSTDTVYKCKVGHLSIAGSLGNRPTTGGYWPDNWEFFGYTGRLYQALWFGICCGTADLLSIYKNTDVLLEDGTDYTADQFNGGEGAYYPIGIFNTAKLPKIAHILFGGEHSIFTNVDEKIPDIRFILARRLPATISHTELYATAEYSYYGNTWVQGFTYQTGILYQALSWIESHDYIIGDLVLGTSTYTVYKCKVGHLSIAGSLGNRPTTGDYWPDNWEFFGYNVAWESGGLRPFFVIYNKMIRLLMVESHLSTWADWVRDEPGLVQATWSYEGYEWSLQGENFYPWEENKVYPAPIAGYKDNDLVIGKDNNVYRCSVDHVPDYTNEPAIGAQWADYWVLFGWDTPEADPHAPYPVGIILIATDGKAYRCIQANTWPTNLPPSGASWQDYWQLASLPTWVNNKTYYLMEYYQMLGATYQPGMVILGSDGNRYKCGVADAYPYHLPITDPIWTDYWVSEPTQFPVTADEIVGGTDGKAYIAELSSHLSELDRRPVSGDDWSGYWNEIFAPDIFLGNNPAAIAYDILTNTFYGLSIPADKIDIASFNAAAVYYNSKDYGLNLKITDIAEARKVLNQLIDFCDLVLTVGVNGLIQCKTFDPEAESIGTLSDDDYSSFVLTKQGWKDLYNEFEATYSDPARIYEATSIILKNEAAIEMADGIVKKKTFDLTAFTNRTICASRLVEIMRRESYPRNTVSCEVSGAWYFARPCDLIKIIKSEYGINNYFRVVSVSTGKIDELNISLELIDATEVMFKEWDEPVVSERRRRLISPIGAPFTQGKI